MVDFDEGPDEVEIAQKVADAMDRTVFYTRQELELLARQALKENNLPSGEELQDTQSVMCKSIWAI